MSETPSTEESAGQPSESEVPARTMRRTVLAGIAGNVMEWYDFAVYGYFAAILGQHFFPSDDPTTSTIASFGAFAAGFVVRPLGAIVFGHIGDKIGRKRALTLSVIMMAVPTFLIGLLPTYEQIGVTAAVLLVALRMLQGLSVGGEYTTSITFMVERGDQKRRGLMGSFSPAGGSVGFLFGSGVGAIIANVMSPEALHDWGWRLPFLAGICIAFCAIYIRRHMEEDVMVAEEDKEPISPVITAFKEEWRSILKIVGFNIYNGVSFYLIFVYVSTWLHQTAHVSTADALDINTVIMVILVVLTLMFGWLSDRIGRRPILITAGIGLILFTYPLMWLMHHESLIMVFAGQLGLTVIAAMIPGCAPATMVELLPHHVRVTCMSIGYNLSLGLIGGTTPLVAAYLVSRTHEDLAPAFYLMAAAAVSLAFVLSLKDGSKAPLK